MRDARSTPAGPGQNPKPNCTLSEAHHNAVPPPPATAAVGAATTSTPSLPLLDQVGSGMPCPPLRPHLDAHHYDAAGSRVLPLTLRCIAFDYIRTSRRALLVSACCFRSTFSLPSRANVACSTAFHSLQRNNSIEMFRLRLATCLVWLGWIWSLAPPPFVDAASITVITGKLLKILEALDVKRHGATVGQHGLAPHCTWCPSTLQTRSARSRCRTQASPSTS